jgi:hypothetical protein
MEHLRQMGSNLLRMREILSSNLDPDTLYFDGAHSLFTSYS